MGLCQREGCEESQWGMAARSFYADTGMEAPSGVEPLFAALQAAPFALGYGASVHMWWSQRDLNPCFRLEGRRPYRLDDGTAGHV
jgi:hypothetical protein